MPKKLRSQPVAAASAPPSSRRWLGAGLVALVWIVFGQTLTHDFVNYDDQAYVFENAQVLSGLTGHGLVWAFTRTHSFNWHPVTWISHMLDCQLFGLHAGGHHLTNVLLHSLATLLLFFVFRRITGATWRSAFVAAIFAIHPLHVESVAWIAERKDLLSGVFFMLTLDAYFRYVRNPSPGRYLLVALFFALGLMSKPMLVSLPLVLLILDWWPLARLPQSSGRKTGNPPELWKSWRNLVREKIPLFLLAFGSCVATLIAQQQAIAPVDQLPLLLRLHNAVISIVVYLWQMIAPLHLAPLYLYSQKWMPLQAALSLILVILVSWAAIALRRKYPYLLAGWLWYLIMLLPVLGILQVGWQSHADRYTYLPQIGLYAMIAWGIADLSVAWPRRREILGAAAGLVIVALTFLAFQQTAYWRNTETLWRHAITVTPTNYVARTNLGDALLKKGALDEAIQTYQVALSLSPNNADAENGLAGAYGQKGQNDVAIEHFRKAIAQRPDDPEYRNNFGNALCQKALVEQGIAEYQKALELRTDRADVHNAETEFNLANALLSRNRMDDAILHYQRSLEIQPNDASTIDHLGTALMRRGKIPEAMYSFANAVRVDPLSSAAAGDYAWALATCPDTRLRNPTEAVHLARRACDLTSWQDPIILRTLAAAYAGAGQFSEAVATARKALAFATAQSNARLGKALEREISLYQANSPYQEPPR